MFGLSILVYVTAIAAFASLYSYEASKSTVETTIVPFDNSGNDGYTCQMISRVTAAYQYPAKADPAISYGLVNIIETKSQCDANFKLADPCSLPLTYFPGSATPRDTSGAAYKATALYGDEVAFVIDFSDELPTMYNYTYSTGLVSQDMYSMDYKYEGVDGYIAETNSLAVDRDGYPIFAAALEDGSTDKIIFRSSPEFSGVNEIAFNTNWSGAITLLNDNLYNIYMIENNTVLTLDVYSSPAVSSVLFTVPGDVNILYAAVYHDGTSPSVYYYTTTSAPQDKMYKYKDGVISTPQLLSTNGDHVRGLLVDGLDNVYVVQQVSASAGQPPGDFLVSKYVVGIEDGYTAYNYYDVGTFTQFTAASGFAINPSGTRILAVEKNTITSVENWSFLYLDPLAPIPENNYDDENVVVKSQIVRVQAEFGAGFFSCGSQVLNTTQYTPGVAAEYPQDCPSNGIVGKVVYNQPNLYMFTPTDAATYAVSNAVSYCSTLYTPICTTVSNLPPYSCSRTIRQGFFSCAATAVANTQFLVQLLIFVCAMLLPRLAARFPYQVTTPVGTVMKHHHSHSEGQEQHSIGSDIEMGALDKNEGRGQQQLQDTTNPML